MSWIRRLFCNLCGAPWTNILSGPKALRRTEWRLWRIHLMIGATSPVDQVMGAVGVAATGGDRA
jgi:hypothetical protein